MAVGDVVTTIAGNLAGDPELRFTPSGAAVANFTVASTPRKFNRQTNEWEEGETLWMRCSIWREAAENAAESLSKGMRVMVHGRLVQRSWEDSDGNKRVSVEMQAEEVGPSLKYATAKVTKMERQGGQQQAQGGQGQQGHPQGPQGQQGAPQQALQQQQGWGQQQQPQQDPWATGGQQGYDQPPF